jgi:hypothetical protein
MARVASYSLLRRSTPAELSGWARHSDRVVRRALRYRDRANECRQLAELTGKLSDAIDISEDYRKIAEHYLTLAEAEERFFENPAPGAV